MATDVIHALVPAAGSGERMGGDVPKQYMTLAGRTVLEHSLQALAAHPRVAGITVVLAPGDHRFDDISLPDCPVQRVDGGRSRAESVLNGLEALTDDNVADWAMVHDAARPCLDQASLDRLVAGALSHESGALLASPMRDTMKRDDGAGCVASTVDREGLWAAQTPQLFRLPLLLSAVRSAVALGDIPTDEAAAMERAGHRPRLVRGAATNQKLTWPEDRPWMEAWLERRALSE